MENQHHIVQVALQAAPACNGLVFGDFTPAVASNPEHTAGELTVTFKGQVTVFQVEAMARFYKVALERLIAEGNRRGHGCPVLLITDYVGPAHADLLRQAGVAFLDTAGNASLELPGLNLLIQGKPRPAPVGRPVAGRMFHRTGLKLVFAFLADPHLDATSGEALFRQPFRSVRDQTGVALGSIAAVMAELKERGYLVEGQDGWRLVNRKQLFAKWATAYGDRLRQRLVRQRYRAPRPRWWQETEGRTQGVFWGGEVAAAKLTGFLKPEAACVYAIAEAQGFILTHDLRPDPHGDVEILDAFWCPYPEAVRGDCVHPLLVYADLLASDIDRNLDTAQRVYDQHLRKILDPD